MPDIPLPWEVPGAVGDAIVPDRKMRATEILRAGGFPARALKEGAAVMGAESGFNPDADNGVCCVGLMQVNLNHAGSYGIPSNKDEAKKWLKHPINNARAAYGIWKDAGGTFDKDWEVKMNGRWRSYYGQDPLITVDSRSAFDPITDTVGGAVDVVTSPFDAVQDLASALLSKDTYFRLGKGLLGGWLIGIGVAGLVFVVARKAVNSDAGKAALDIVPAGKVTKIAKVAK